MAALTQAAQVDERLILLTADLGYMALEAFADRFPKRFFNVGVSEQNMVGVATGLADAGFIPFVYSIGTFAALRPYEFIRNGPVLHGLPVRVVGVGGGMEYGHNGISHYALEDIAVMRAQPSMTVLAPADAAQAASALLATYDRPGPIYYRLGKDDRIRVAGLDGRFRFGELETVQEGRDALIISSGAAANVAVGAADCLRSGGVAAEVAVAATLAPAPRASLIQAIRRHSVVATVEAHYVTGGLGSLVAEIIAEGQLRVSFIRCGVTDMPIALTGSQAFMESCAGLTPEVIAQRVSSAVLRFAEPVPR